MAASERIESAVVRAVVAMPPRLQRLLAGRPIQREGQTLHPQVQLALRLEKLTGGSELLPVAEARERRLHEARVFSGPVIEVGRVEEMELPGPAGVIPARLYTPAGVARPAPLVVYFHGGGHVVGDLDTHDQPCRYLCREVPALVLAIDYRLGPEHPFPAAVEDCHAAFRWAAEHAEGLGADPARVAVCGDSAGGNLAAAVTTMLVAEDGPRPAFQCLIYPVTDYSEKRPSYEKFSQGFFLTSEEMDWYRDNYFVSEADRTDPRASPILAPDLSGQPPAFVVTAGFDPLRDEGEAYAERLRDAGVDVTLRREPDLVHGYINAVGLGGRPQEAMKSIAEALREGLGATRAPASAVGSGP